MRKKAIILGTCIILFVGGISTQMGRFMAGTDKEADNTDDTNADSYEYYYDEDNNNSEEDNVINPDDVSANEDDKAKRIKVDRDPSSYTVLVNRKYKIPKDYVPGDLVVPNVRYSYYGVYEKSYMRKRAAEALEDLFAAAGRKGHILKVVSAYRSYERQTEIYNKNVSTRGVEKTNKVSAEPGSSEHQTGLAIDVSCDGVGCGLEESFGKTAEGKWLRKHCQKFGFIIRYPKKKTGITGYSYEPWHIRYVGKNLAKYLNKNHLTLEEYYKLTTVDNKVKEDVISDTDENMDMSKEPQMTAAPTPKPTPRPTKAPGYDHSTLQDDQETPATRATRKPVVTHAPKVTEEPDTWDEPEDTPKPVKTPKPERTPRPEKTPKPTKAPVITKAPVPTPEPVKTEPPMEEDPEAPDNPVTEPEEIVE